MKIVCTSAEIMDCDNWMSISTSNILLRFLYTSICFEWICKHYFACYGLVNSLGAFNLASEPLAGLVRNCLFGSLLQLVFIVYSDNQFDASKLIVFFFWYTFSRVKNLKMKICLVLFHWFMIFVIHYMNNLLFLIKLCCYVKHDNH